MTISVGFNQTFDSSLPIPGAIAGDNIAARGGCIRICVGSEHTETTCPPYERQGDALIFNAPKVASYRCWSDAIEVNPCPGSDPDWVTGLLIATAIPATLWMQGRFVLHAAAIVPKGGSHAIAIAGASSAGKSVLAKQLLKRGALLLADDSVALEVTGDAIIASGLPGGIHRRTGNGDNRCFKPVAADQCATSAPLGAIIVLEGFADIFSATALDKLSAVEKIVAHRHRPRIPAMLGRSGPVLAQAAMIADRVPVIIWGRCEGETALSPLEHDAFLAMLR